MANRIWTIRNIGEGCKQISLIHMSLFATLGFWRVSFNHSMSGLKCIIPIGEIAPQLREFSEDLVLLFQRIQKWFPPPKSGPSQ